MPHTVTSYTQSLTGLKQSKLIICNDIISYLNFCRYPQQRNFHFYPTNYASLPISLYEKLWTDITAVNEQIPNEIKLSWATSGQFAGTELKKDTKPSTDCYLWVSDEPFSGWPNDQDCLQFEPINNTCRKTTLTSFDKAILIPAERQGAARVKVTAPNKNKYLWLKWSTDGTYGGGTLIIPDTLQVTTQ